MKLQSLMSLLALSLVGSMAYGQDAQPARPPRPDELYKFARDKISEGQYDLAADYLDRFFGTNPPPQLYLDLQTRYGTTTFLQLRNVLRWSDNAAANTAANALVEKIISASEAANVSVIRNPERIQKFVDNLVSRTKEERIYARQQLRPAGDVVVPVMVNVLRTSLNREHQAEILGFIPGLNDTTVQGFLAAFEGMPREIQPGLLQAITNRPDVLDLVVRAETDFTPLLWYLASDPVDSALRQTARDLLASLTGGRSARLRAEDELTRMALPFFQRTAEFRTLDKLTNKVRVVTWDASKLALRTDEVSQSRAEEFYGLRMLRWALARKPNHQPAQDLFVALATERAVERAKFGDLAQADPSVYGLLAAVPSAQVVEMLEASLKQKRTALALGLIQALSDRIYKDSKQVLAPREGERSPDGGAKPTERPSPLFLALQYPDPRIQFAAAVAILKSPGSPTHGQSARIVDILRRALAGEVEGSAEGKLGKVLIADPDSYRGNRLAVSFRNAGFSAERLANGRDLIARIARASDYDGIIIDRRIPNPLLPDLLGQLADDPRAARRPTLVVASMQKTPAVPFEHQLLRLALLVAATETDSIKVPDPDPKPSAKTLVDVTLKGEKVKMSITSLRDLNLNQIANARIQRLERLTKSAELPASEVLQKRIEIRRSQFTYAALVIEYLVTPTSAPETYGLFHSLTETIRLRTDLMGQVEKLLPSDLENLVLIIEQLDSKLSPDQRKKFDMLREKITPESLAIESEVVRDPEIERQLAKTVRPYKFVTVIPETFDPSTLTQDLAKAAVDPSQLPRDPAERAAVARVAMEWLRKIATGELPGYEANPATFELRAALRSDQYADLAVEAVARFGSADAQRELVEVASNPKRPAAIRLKAADAALRHVQVFGKLTPAAIAEAAAANAATDTDPAVRSKLDLLARQIAVKPAGLGTVIQGYPLTPALPVAPAPKGANPADPPKEPDPKDPPKM